MLQVDATARGAHDCWNIEVTIAGPILGQLTAYRGDIVPRPCSP
jgi:hypothetical protein